MESLNFVRKILWLKVLNRSTIPTIVRIAMLLLLGVAFVLGVSYIWNLPKAEIDKLQSNLPPDEKLTLREQSELVDKRRNTLVGSIGTLATIAGGVVLFLNFGIAQRRLAIDTTKIDSEAKLAESRLTAERFSKAIEQLGSKSIHVRLGGIYSLENLARDSQNDYWTVMEVLTAFVREKVPRVNKDHEYLRVVDSDELREAYDYVHDPSNYDPVSIPMESETDIKAAVSVIGRRRASKEDGHLNDKGEINLSLTNLCSINLSSSNLGKANLRMTCLADSDLTEANLRRTDLSNSILSRAKLSRADLGGANLKSSWFHDADLTDANLTDADLTDAYLTGATVMKEQLSEAILCRTKLPIDIDLDSNRDCSQC